MGEVIRPDFGKKILEPGAPKRSNVDHDSDVVIEKKIAEAKLALGERIGDPTAEGKLLLLNNLLDLQPMINYLQSLSGRSVSLEVKAVAAKHWRERTDQELLNSVLQSREEQWQKSPGRYWELIYEYQRRVREIIGAQEKE